MHDDQLFIDESVVRQLVAEQFPQWRDLAVVAVPTSATVNAIFRLGDRLAARFPLRAGDPAVVRRWLVSEFDAAAEFAGASPVPSPEPVAVGAPGHGYPLPWMVQSWVPGRDATVEDPGGSVTFAEQLADLIARLRRVEVRGRQFSGRGRGGDLRDHDQWMALCFDNSESMVDVPRLRDLWARLRELPRVDDDRMCHGDLTPPNVLVDSGRLVGVLDTGGFAAADPALDLVAAWHLLDAAPRQVLREQLGCSDNEWLRGMAWALQQAMGLVWYYASSNPVMSRWGSRTLDRLLAADSP
jgi:aminoglycoside phosphotransferase (APT) family kinase protein